MKSKKFLGYFSGALAFFGGAVLFGLSMNLFLSPAKVVMGGATGVATVINFIFPSFPIGITIIAINAPLLLLNAKQMGYHAMLKTLVGIVVSSVMIDIVTFFPVTIYDPLLCSVLGGITMGVGSGLMLTRGFTTGGSDLAAIMLHRHIKKITTGRIILIIDVIVVLGAAAVTKNYEGVFYSAISIFTYSASIDAVLGGSERAKMVLVISKRHADISKAVAKELDRGITLLQGKGWYTGDEREVLMCVVKRHEEYMIKNIVEKIDPVAFMIFTDATEVLGEGFKNITETSPKPEKKIKKKVGKNKKHGGKSGAEKDKKHDNLQ